MCQTLLCGLKVPAAMNRRDKVLALDEWRREIVNKYLI
jgi:hypothetical protein